MRILYLNGHQVYINGLPWGFRELGHDVRIVEVIQQDHLFRTIETFQPNLLVSAGWIDQYTPDKLAVIKQAAQYFGCLHAYWATEDINHLDRWSLPMVKAVQADVVFSINAECVPVYQNLGIPAFYLPFGYSPVFESNNTEPDPRYTHDISLVANAYDVWSDTQSVRRQSVETLVRPLVEADYDLALWGKGWNPVYWSGVSSARRIRHFQGVITSGFGQLFVNSRKGVRPITVDSFTPQPHPSPIGQVHYPGVLAFEDAFRVFKQSKIMLNLQNEDHSPTQLTSRTFEILGCGGFQLSLRTPAVKKLFAHGRHLIMSSSPAETLELVDYYLAHEEERMAIAANGRAEILAKHTYDERTAYMLACLDTTLDKLDKKKARRLSAPNLTKPAPKLSVKTVQSTANAYVCSNTPNMVYAKKPFLLVGFEWRDPVGWSNAIAYLRFDFGVIPPDAKINAAFLYLWLNWKGPIKDVIGFCPVLEPWSSKTLSWSNQPAYSQPIAQINVEGHQKSGWLSGDITSLARKWLSNPLINHGICLHSLNKDVSATIQSLASREWTGGEEFKPYLAVVYY